MTGTADPVVVELSDIFASIFLPPFAPPTFTGINARTQALTSARSAR